MIANPSQQLNEDELLLSRVAEDYRREGFEVIIEPQPDELPFDLDLYHPDLLVKNLTMKVLLSK